MTHELYANLQSLNIQKKVTNPRIIKIVCKLAYKWGVTPAEAMYRMMCETAIKLHDEDLLITEQK